MPPVEARSVSPTLRVPEIPGAPVAGVFVLLRCSVRVVSPDQSRSEPPQL